MVYGISGFEAVQDLLVAMLLVCSQWVPWRSTMMEFGGGSLSVTSGQAKP